MFAEVLCFCPSFWLCYQPALHMGQGCICVKEYPSVEDLNEPLMLGFHLHSRLGWSFWTGVLKQEF